MIPHLVDEYHKARNVVIITSALIILWHFGIPFKGTLPFINIELGESLKLPYILSCILGYGVFRVLVEWFQSESERRKLLPSRIDLGATLIVASISGFLLLKKLAFPLSLPKVNIFSSLAIIAVGVAVGEFIDIAIFNLFLIRSKEEAKKMALPRIPVAVRATWRMAYIILPALLLVIFLSPSYTEPLSNLWLYLLITPVLLMFLSGLSSLLFTRHTDSEGNRITRSQFIKSLRKAFDRHDAHYQIGGWDRNVPPANSSLYEAAERGDIESLKMILSDKVEIDEINMHGWTALMIAVAQQHAEAAVLLLEYGANPNIGNTFGRTPLMFASRYGNKSLIHNLLKFGADPNLNNSNDPSALSSAAVSGDKEIIKILLDAGADPTLKDYDGKIATEYAEQYKHGEIAALLRKTIRAKKT
ncbi:MAG: ankyrin repeat domain-containing protein [Desulfobulbaceae bacterium]|nr:ankyrin repeat domain-containing protein [Desulfobulbaceae bacterium]